MKSVLLVCAALAVAASGLSFDASAKDDGMKPARVKPNVSVRAKVNGTCTEVGCNETWANQDLTTINGEGCDPSRNVSYTLTWTRQSNGTYTVTHKTEQLVEACPPM